MRQVLERVAELINVKSMVTFMVMYVFARLSVSGAIAPEQALTIITVVVSFYFGTQKQKLDDESREYEG